MRRLSERQVEHLRILLAAREPRGSYPGLNLNTLSSLETRGLVRSSYQTGHIAMPHTSIKWSITEAGRAALMATELPQAKRG